MFFICDFFNFFFIEVPPQFLPKMKRFVTLKDSSRFSALCDFKKIAGDLQKNFSKIFWKNFGKFFAKQKDMGSSPALEQNFFVQIFFGFVRLFFANISKGSTRHFFVYFAKNGCSKTPRVPPFTCFGTMRLTGNQKNSKKKFKKFGIFFPIFPQAGTVEENT